MNDPPPARADCDSAPAQRLESLFREVHGELLGTLFYLVGNLEDARDALQETFLKCWRHQQQVPDVENLKAWVFRIALNTGRDVRKTAWNRRRKSLLSDPSQAPDDAVSANHRFTTSDPPDAALIRNEELCRLRDAVLKLREEEQEVFLLRQNGGLSYPEIAAATSLPLGTVKTRMRAAIGQLRMAVGETS